MRGCSRSPVATAAATRLIRSIRRENARPTKNAARQPSSRPPPPMAAAPMRTERISASRRARSISTTSVPRGPSCETTGATTRSLYLPRDAATPGWRCYHTGEWHPSGATITVDAPLDRLPLFVRAGAILPTTDATDGAGRTDEPSRALRLFPAPPDSGRVVRTSRWIEDDGISGQWKDGLLATVQCTLTGDAETLALELHLEGTFQLPCGRVRIVLPPDEMRDITVESASLGVPVAR